MAVPPQLRAEVVEEIHEGYPGIGQIKSSQGATFGGHEWMQTWRTRSSAVSFAGRSHQRSHGVSFM